MEKNQIYRGILGNSNDILDAVEGSMMHDDVVEWLNTEGGIRNYKEGSFWEYIDEDRTIHIKDSILSKPDGFFDERPPIRACIYEDVRYKENGQEVHTPILSWMVFDTVVRKKELPSMCALGWSPDDLHVQFDGTFGEHINTLNHLVLTYFGDMDTNLECKDAANLEQIRTLMIRPRTNRYRIENISNLRYILPNTSFRDVRLSEEQSFNIKFDSFTDLKATTIIVPKGKLLYGEECLFEDLTGCERKSVNGKLKDEWDEFMSDIAHLSSLNPELYYIKTYITETGWKKNTTTNLIPVTIDIKETVEKNELMFM